MTEERVSALAIELQLFGAFNQSAKMFYQRISPVARALQVAHRRHQRQLISSNADHHNAEHDAEHRER
jgi:hypothetical protein